VALDSLGCLRVVPRLWLCGNTINSLLDNGRTIYLSIVVLLSLIIYLLLLLLLLQLLLLLLLSLSRIYRLGIG